MKLTPIHSKHQLYPLCLCRITELRRGIDNGLFCTGVQFVLFNIHRPEPTFSTNDANLHPDFPGCVTAIFWLTKLFLPTVGRWAHLITVSATFIIIISDLLEYQTVEYPFWSALYETIEHGGLALATSPDHKVQWSQG